MEGVEKKIYRATAKSLRLDDRRRTGNDGYGTESDGDRHGAGNHVIRTDHTHDLPPRRSGSSW